MAESDDPDVILRRDHAHMWRLPPLPRRFPFIDLGWLIVLAGVAVAAVILAVGD